MAVALATRVAAGAAAEADPAAIPRGAMLERESFRVSRRVPDAPAGLTVLILDADVLGRTNHLADVRIADSSGRQVPYLVEHRAEPLTLSLRLPPRSTAGQSSIYRVALRYEQYPADTRLVLTSGARVFERLVKLRRVANNPRNRRASDIASAVWRGDDPGGLPPPLSFDFAVNGARAIEIVVDEGDNAPLPLASAELVLPSAALRFEHPGSPLFLLYGNRHVSAPRYDIALLATRLSGEPARVLTLPSYTAAHEDEEDSPARKLFWVGIGVAAIVLIVMLVRLLSSETSPAPPGTT